MIKCSVCCVVLDRASVWGERLIEMVDNAGITFREQAVDGYLKSGKN